MITIYICVVKLRVIAISLFWHYQVTQNCVKFLFALILNFVVIFTSSCSRPNISSAGCFEIILPASDPVSNTISKVTVLCVPIFSAWKIKWDNISFWSGWKRSTESSTHSYLDVIMNLLCSFNLLNPTGYVMHQQFNILKPAGHVMDQQFNIQQLYVLPILYLCVLYLSENKQRLVPLTA